MIGALEKQDVSAFSDYIADDALFVDSNGSLIETKQELLKDISKVDMKKEHVLIKNRRVLSAKVNGDNAVVIERVWRSNGKTLNENLTSTSVFAKRNQEWKLVMSSNTVDYK